MHGVYPAGSQSSAFWEMRSVIMCGFKHMDSVSINATSPVNDLSRPPVGSWSVLKPQAFQLTQNALLQPEGCVGCECINVILVMLLCVTSLMPVVFFSSPWNLSQLVKTCMLPEIGF